jgi:predicted transcriptional regulator
MAKFVNKQDVDSEKALLNATEFFESKIKDVMKQRIWDIPIIAMDSEIMEVIAILCTNDHVWVVDNLKDKKVVGVITEHDILHALRPIKRHRFFGMPSRKGMGLSLFETAEHIMSHDPFTCTPDEKVKDVLHTLEAHGVRRIPVVSPKTNEIISEITVHQLIKKYYSAVKPLCEICEAPECKLKEASKSASKT